MLWSAVLREEQYEYVQSTAAAGCMEERRIVENAAKPKSVDANRWSIFKEETGIDRLVEIEGMGGALSAGREVTQISVCCSAVNEPMWRCA